MSDRRYGNDLTQGSMLKHVIDFSIPMLAGNLLQALYNTVDSIWVGKYLGAEALGAVSISFPIIFVLISLIFGMTMATTTLVSQFLGSRREDMVQKTANNSFFVLSIAAVVATILGIAYNEDILRLINTPEEILVLASSYLNIFLAGLIFMFGYNTASAILRGMGDSKTPVVFLSIATVINIILDPILILGVGPFPRMGVAGAALATTISQAVSFIAAAIYLGKKGHLLSLNPRHFKFDRDLTAKMVKIGIPAGLQMSVVSIGMLVVNSVINSFGTDTVASFGMAARLDQFAIMPSQSIAMATSAIAGQNIGAGKDQNVKETVKWSNIIAAAIALMITLIAQLTPRTLLGLFTSDQSLLALGQHNLRILSLSYIPTAIMFTTNGLLRGAGDTFPTMVFSITSLWLIRVPLAKLLSNMPNLGADGIWIAIVISSIISMLMSRIYYATGRWKHKNVIGRGPNDLQPES
jgi:putative MATE family efflux protein